jgi:adenylate cyclase
VIGDPVNVAARVEAATRQTGDAVLLAARTVELLSEAATVELVERPGVELRGKKETVPVYAAVRGGDRRPDAAASPQAAD